MPELLGQLVDLVARRIVPGRLAFTPGGPIAFTADAAGAGGPFLLPGFVDAHIHVESSMLPPHEFARQALIHGTVATVSDPHEIANVLGADGVHYMIRDGAGGPFHFCWGAPPCVPATTFETAGATLDARAVSALLELDAVGYLSEVMNFPGVLQGDPDLLAKIAAAQRLGKPVDGHAPGLRGDDARRYAAAGIQTDHECFTLDEALDKLAAGMRILIREGSAARNYEALRTLLRTHPDRCMFCSDDKHPDALVAGHINRLCARAVADGFDALDVLGVACLNPVRHYHLPTGLLQPGDPATFTVVRDLTSFDVLETWVRGERVASGGACHVPFRAAPVANRFAATPVDAVAFDVRLPGPVRVIRAHNGQLVTTAETAPSGTVDVSDDRLLITVVNRYAPAPPAVAFIRGFGLRSGAIASSVAHDSHNIVAVGASPGALAAAVNSVIAAGGGISAVDRDGAARVLPLPIAGLMSPDPAETVARRYEELDAFAKHLGSPLDAPFMTLSFMALLVIPSLKLSDLGLFDGATFSLVPARA